MILTSMSKGKFLSDALLSNKSIDSLGLMHSAGSSVVFDACKTRYDKLLLRRREFTSNSDFFSFYFMTAIKISLEEPKNCVIRNACQFFFLDNGQIKDRELKKQEMSDQTILEITKSMLST